MWGSFSAWCLAQSPAITLESVDMQTLAAFQAARFGLKSTDLSLTPRHALRLLRLIGRVLEHQAALTNQPPNTAAADWIAAQPQVRYADAANADPLPLSLSASEARRLIKHLTTNIQVQRKSRNGQAENVSTPTWQNVRNCAAAALQLGAGLTPSDVRALLLTSPVTTGGRVTGRPWKIAVPQNGTMAAREAPMAPWAGEILRRWLLVRAQNRIAGGFLFPSTRTGKPWSKNAQYKTARQVCKDAALDDGEGGSFRLRHTFALRQLRRGTSPEQLARWMGIEPEAMDKYLRIVPVPQAVV